MDTFVVQDWINKIEYRTYYIRRSRIRKTFSFYFTVGNKLIEKTSILFHTTSV